MEDWFTRRAGKLAIKEALAIGFFAACGLAKFVPIFDDGNYKADALLYMLLIGLASMVWDMTR